MPRQTGGEGRRVTVDADPLILTLGFETTAFERFDSLRRAYLPAALNVIPAHLTLFHHLPGDQIDPVSVAVEQAASRVEAFEVHVTGLRKLGRGVALEIVSVPLLNLRAQLAGQFAAALTPQDRQGFRPHVTIQNKVDPKIATALFERLSAEFTPWQARAEALLLWRYRGGPWEQAGRFAFRSEA